MISSIRTLFLFLTPINLQEVNWAGRCILGCTSFDSGARFSEGAWGRSLRKRAPP